MKEVSPRSEMSTIQLCQPVLFVWMCRILQLNHGLGPHHTVLYGLMSLCIWTHNSFCGFYVNLCMSVHLFVYFPSQVAFSVSLRQHCVQFICLDKGRPLLKMGSDLVISIPNFTFIIYLMRNIWPNKIGLKRYVRFQPRSKYRKFRKNRFRGRCTSIHFFRPVTSKFFEV